MAGMTPEAILRELATMHQWAYEGGELSRRFRFKDFCEAFDFVTQAAALQQEMKRYGRVTQEGPIVMIDLWSDEDGPVNGGDIALARRLSACAGKAM